MRRYSGPISLVLFDVDGVLTDGTLFVGPEGEVVKGFNVRDGLAVSLLSVHGIMAGVLSGKSSLALDFRVQQLDFKVAITGSLDKASGLEVACQKLDVAPSNVVYVGDDVVDLPLAGRVARFYAPSDAHPLVRRIADEVVPLAGGRGVAREVAESILVADGMSLAEAYEPLQDSWGTNGAVQ